MLKKLWLYLNLTMYFWFPQFFSPLTPVRVEFEFAPNGRPTGEANVDFKTHSDAVEAMSRHKKNMRKYMNMYF